MTAHTKTHLDPASLLPPGEEMAPDTPSDALGRYLALLLRWDVLTRRQHAYEAERLRLEVLRQALEEQWADIRAEHQACLDALATCPLPLDEAIRDVWMLSKVHLMQLVEPNPAYRGIMPEVLREFLTNRTFHALGRTRE